MSLTWVCGLKITYIYHNDTINYQNAQSTNKTQVYIDKPNQITYTFCYSKEHSVFSPYQIYHYVIVFIIPTLRQKQAVIFII